MPLQTFTVDHVVVVASDVLKTVAFYEAVFGAHIHDLDAWQAGNAEYPVVHLGTWKINVHPAATDAAPRSARPLPGGLDIALRWNGSINDAVEWLAQNGVEPELGPIPQVGALGHADSIYFRDPDGALLELICYADVT